MAERSRFVALEPVDVALKSVGKKGFTTLIATGIVNPAGPTLNVVAADGYFPTAQGRIPILHFMLNPFSQTCRIVGAVELRDEWSPLDDLEPFMSLEMDPARRCCCRAFSIALKAMSLCMRGSCTSAPVGRECCRGWNSIRVTPGAESKTTLKPLSGPTGRASVREHLIKPVPCGWQRFSCSAQISRPSWQLSFSPGTAPSSLFRTAV